MIDDEEQQLINTTSIPTTPTPTSPSTRTENDVKKEEESKKSGSKIVTEIQTSHGVVKLPSLFDACKTGHLPIVRYYLENDPSIDIDAVDKDDGTLLHWATSKGFYDIMVYLIRRGADLNSRNETGQTSLHWAASVGNVKSFHILIMTGADAAAVDNKGHNVMHFAAIYNKVYIAYYLYNKGFPLNTRDSDGHTPFHWAVYNESLDVMRLLHKLGADINSPDAYGRTPLHWAASGSNQRIVRTLLSWGARPDRKDDDGSKPDVIAQAKGHKYAAKLLQQALVMPLDRKHLREYGNIWTLGVITAYLLGSFMLAYFPILFNMVVFFCVAFFVRRKYSLTFPDAVVNCKAWASFFVMTWLVGSLYMNVKVIPGNTSNLLLCAVAVVLDIVTIVVYWKLAKSNPGEITPSPLAQEELERMAMADEYLGDFCPTCLIIRPARSKHCETCDACVARFDHHCVWVDKCIGYLNNTLFIVYLIVLLLLQIVFVILSCIYFYNMWGELSTGVQSIFDIARVIWDEASLGVCLCMLFVVQILWEGMLLFQQCKNAMNNITTNERINWHKYTFMKDPKTGKRVNPFKLPTVKENIKEFVKGGRNWFTFRWVDLLPPNQTNIPANNQEV